MPETQNMEPGPALAFGHTVLRGGWFSDQAGDFSRTDVERGNQALGRGHRTMGRSLGAQLDDCHDPILLLPTHRRSLKRTGFLPFSGSASATAVSIMTLPLTRRSTPRIPFDRSPCSRSRREMRTKASGTPR